MLACENKCGADLGRAVEQGGGEDGVFRQRPIQRGEAADRPCCPSMAAQVPDVHGGRLHGGVPLLEAAGGLRGGVPLLEAAGGRREGASGGVVVEQ